MRSLLQALSFSVAGIGFLLILAHSWQPESEPSPHPTRSLSSQSENAGHAPAPSPQASWVEIRRIEGCLKGEHCLLPRAALADALAITLAEHLTNFGAEPELARVALASGEPIAQAVGLRILAALPPSASNISALENGLRASRDPALLKTALHELGRYVGSPLETEAQKLVEGYLSYDFHLDASQAQAVLPFINEHSYSEFRELFSALEPGAGTREVLGAALKQYETKAKP